MKLYRRRSHTTLVGERGRTRLYENESHARLEVVGISLTALLERSFIAACAGGVHDVRRIRSP